LIFHETKLDGAFVIEPKRREDNRGSFARIYCTEQFGERGLDADMVQGNISSTTNAGTLRGMHYQVPPMMEAKYIRCLRGAVYDVIVDLRPWSPSYLQHFGVELTQDNRLGIYVPPLFAHGHQALADDVEITYLVSKAYTPGLERGIRFDDPMFAIDWPLPIGEMSEKDLEWQAFDPVTAGCEMQSAAPQGFVSQR
jgi:dTDP-4-dehydrorhamnose 3,5-epimerase